MNPTKKTPLVASLSWHDEDDTSKGLQIKLDFLPANNLGEKVATELFFCCALSTALDKHLDQLSKHCAVLDENPDKLKATIQRMYGVKI